MGVLISQPINWRSIFAYIFGSYVKRNVRKDSALILQYI